MAASSHSLVDAHGNTLGSVFDRRPYLSHPRHRARFPSLTEFPDSPSVYSHVHHSPDVDLHSDTASLSRISDSPDFQEFNNETASTVRSLSTRDGQDDSDTDHCTDDTSHRMSLQGPKIRFHSPAPWETDNVVPHGDESDNSSRSATIGIGKKLKGKASRADNLIRTFTRGPPIVSRPSVDSACSRSSATSFEITSGNYSSPRGALYDLAKQSMSTSSLSSAASASLRRESFARVTNYSKPSHHSTQARTVNLNEIAPSSMTLENTPILPSSSDASCIGNECSAKPSQVPLLEERRSYDFVHPYANPDLVVPYTPSPETVLSHHPILGDMNGSDSNSTITDSTSTRSAAFSVSTNETSTSLTSRDFPHGYPRVNGKEISSPVSVLHPGDISYVDRDTKFLSLHPPPTGFDGPRQSNSRPPTVTLITLQEAQARERFRSNTVRTAAARSKLPFPNSDNTPETAEDQREEMYTADILARTPAPSTGIGVRHKTFPLAPTQSQTTETREESSTSTSTSAVPRRALKHKKSGFMRLFGSRNLEGEKEKIPPPPIPTLTDVHAERSLQVHGAGKTSKTTLAKVPKSSSSLPSLGPSNPALASANVVSCGSNGSDEKRLSSRRRQPPSLSIVTRTSDHNVPTSAGEQNSPMSLNLTSPPPFPLSIPQSAPPGNTDFPGLKLRPVSTSFSSQFAGFVADVDVLQHDAYTPSSAASSGTALSPFTPVSTRRSDDASATTVEQPGEECSTIKELRDQLVSVKKAWQQQVSELHGQIRDLMSELEDLRVADHQVYCEACGQREPQGRRAPPSDEQRPSTVGIVNRPWARAGETARFAGSN